MSSENGFLKLLWGKYKDQKSPILSKLHDAFLSDFIFFGSSPSDVGIRMCHACFPLSFADHEDYDPQTVRLGSRYSHVQEVQERLNFLRLVPSSHCCSP